MPAAPRRTLVLGTLADYGGASRRCYRKVVRAALDHVDRLILLRHSASHVGVSAADIAAGTVLLFATVQEITRHVRETMLAGEVIPLKGSRPRRVRPMALPEPFSSR
jgi:UDP-N-acetylmuramyl pentapeptide synthase